jgi:hypothetical protein
VDYFSHYNFDLNLFRTFYLFVVVLEFVDNILTDFSEKLSAALSSFVSSSDKCSDLDLDENRQILHKLWAKQ